MLVSIARCANPVLGRGSGPCVVAATNHHLCHPSINARVSNLPKRAQRGMGHQSTGWVRGIPEIFSKMIRCIFGSFVVYSNQSASRQSIGMGTIHWITQSQGTDQNALECNLQHFYLQIGVKAVRVSAWPEHYDAPIYREYGNGDIAKMVLGFHMGPLIT